MPFAIPMSLIWLIAVIVFIVVEAMTLDLTSIWFAVGGLAAMFADIQGWSVVVQLGVFILTTALSLLLLRKFAKEHFNRRTVRTNADRIIGMTGVVTEAVNNEKSVGQAKIAGQIWTVRSLESERTIAVGEQIVVCEISGVKAIVLPKKEF